MKDNELLYRLGQRLKELRKAKKWSLRDLEALTDIDNSELSKYEFGFISPQLLSLYKLSQAFGITLSKLLDIEKHGQLLFHCTIIDGTQVTHIKRGNIRANIDTFQEGFVFHHQVGVHLPEQQVTLATDFLPIFFNSWMSYHVKETIPPQSAGEENSSTTLSAVYAMSERSSRTMTSLKRERSFAKAVFIESRYPSCPFSIPEDRMTLEQSASHSDGYSL